MKRTTLDTELDCQDFVDGCLWMGTGGGGQASEGLSALRHALHDGVEVGWVDVDSIPDDALAVTAYASGSIAPQGPEVDELIESLHLGDPIRIEEAMVRAVEELGRFLGQPVGAVVPVELGASNSPASLVTAARLGIAVPDGDYSGRAVPDEMQGTPFINEIASYPFSSVDLWGNVAVVPETANAYMLERVSKYLSIAGIHGTSIASTPITGDVMKRIIVRGTLTKSLAIGRAAREARTSGDDPVAAAVEASAGWRLFDGVVTAKDWEDRDGYMFGNIHLDGTYDGSPATLRIWFKNENHISWLNGEPWACSPDLISVVNAETGRGYTSTDIDEGDRVSVVGSRGLDVFRTESALQHAFGPAYFGFPDIAYRPIETLF